MRNARLIPANKDHTVMIKEHDRHLWHVRQTRSDIDPGDPRKIRNTDIIQCYDTPNFLRIFHPDKYYGKKYQNQVDQGKTPVNHKAACLIYEAVVVHDPTLPDIEPVTSKNYQYIDPADDMAVARPVYNPQGDDSGTAKRPVKRNKK